jgi:RNA polymerase primary sigma factor
MVITQTNIDEAGPDELQNAAAFIERRVGAGQPVSLAEFDAVLEELEVPARHYGALKALLGDRGHRIDDDDDDTDEEDDLDKWTGPALDGFAVFATRARHRILTAEEERHLAQRREVGELARQALSDGLVPEAARPDLERQVADGDRASEELYLSNVRLVISIASKYQNRGMELDDLVQEGLIGLHRAVEKFDWTRGFKFSTYATWWVRQAVTRALADKGRLIRIPVHMVETIHRVRREHWKMLHELGREPTAEELAEKLGIYPERLSEIQQFDRRFVSLDRPIGDGGTTLADLVSANHLASPEESAEKALLTEAIDGVLEQLTERERRVVRLRFGLDDGQLHTLEEVGKEFGVTRERIRQIEHKTLAKLAHPKRSARLLAYL